MSYHWFKKMLLSTSILILSSSSLGLATHTVEAKDNLNGEKPTTNLKHNITSPSVNSEMNNNETGTPHESNQTGDEGTGSNSRDANPDSNNVKPDSNNQNQIRIQNQIQINRNRIQNQTQINQSQIRIQNQTQINQSQIQIQNQTQINQSQIQIQNQTQINQSQIRIQNQILISQILTRHQIPINLGIPINLVARKWGTWNPNASDGSNQGQWQPNGNQRNLQNPTGNDFVSQRF